MMFTHTDVKFDNIYEGDQNWSKNTFCGHFVDF